MGATRPAGLFAAGLFAAVLLAALGPSPGAFAQAPADAAVNRVAGDDRFETAAAITAYGLSEYWDAADAAAGRPVSRRAFVVNGTTYPDALAAAAATWGQAAILPVLRSAAPPASVESAYDLRLDHFTGVGGAAAVDGDVLDRLEDEAERRCDDDARTCFVVNARISGVDRYATAALVGRMVASREGFRGTVYLAGGLDFPDALAGGAAAAEGRGMLLLTPPGAVHPRVAELLREVQPGRVVILGGTAAVSAAVERELASSYAVERISGSDRYATAAAISADRARGSVDEVILATGAGFADALAAGPPSAQLGAPLLLTPSDRLPAAVGAEIERLAPCTITVVGGEAAVSSTVAEAAASAAARGGADCP